MKANENEFSSGLKNEKIWIESSSFIERQVQTQHEQYFSKVVNSQYPPMLDNVLVIQLLETQVTKNNITFKSIPTQH